MSKYFKAVSSYEELKTQYKKLLKEHHPDNGGDVDIMQEINIEYDALFPIWKNRHETKTGESVSETAQSTRMQFYTAYGWEGSRYDSNLSTTEISKIIKTYAKEKYPTWKFSVTSKYFSGGSEILICVMEAPVDIFDREYFKGEHRRDTWNFEKMTEEGSYYMQLHRIGDRDREPWLNDIGYTVLRDVYQFMQSYNYDDSDSMIDYFSCNFYSSIYIGKGDKGFRIVPKTARVTKQSSVPASTRKKPKQDNTGSVTGCLSKNYTFHVNEDTDTRDNSPLWVVKIEESLSKEEYIKVNQSMRELGAYYSKFKHGFIFKSDPTDLLENVA